MSRRDQARAHLDKAAEYLDAARVVLDHGFHNATCSLAVTSGINAKDAICLLSVGHSDKSDQHDAAIAELRKSGPVGAALAPTLDRLLSKKAKSQYSSISMTPSDAEDATKRAARLFDAATDLYRSMPRQRR